MGYPLIEVFLNRKEKFDFDNTVITVVSMCNVPAQGAKQHLGFSTFKSEISPVDFY